MRCTYFLIFIVISLCIEFCWAKCEVTFDYFDENPGSEIVLESYLKSRDSVYERFKNIIKRRVADPICMATKSLNEALCECIEEKISGAEAPPPAGPQEQQENEKNGSTEEEPICVWQMLSDRQGISILRFANMYQCKNLFITQGYNAHDGDVYDVFVVEQPNNTVNTFIMKGIAKAINFSKLEIENDRSYIYTVLFNGLYFFKNWDKFW